MASADVPQGVQTFRRWMTLGDIWATWKVASASVKWTPCPALTCGHLVCLLLCELAW